MHAGMANSTEQDGVLTTYIACVHGHHVLSLYPTHMHTHL